MTTPLHTPRPPAEVYDERFVPALFAPYADVVAAAAGVGPGQQVLDVACGTGALALAAAGRVGRDGRVTGVDANPEMLAVARRKRAPVDWVDGRAESLPFADSRFDAVVSQFGLMFFDDRVAALREMRRVVRTPGRVAVAVCDAVEHAPGYAVLARLLDRLFGRGVGDAFRAPFAIGDATLLRSLCRDAGLAGADIRTLSADVRFASTDDLVASERACVWTLGGLLDDDQFDRLRSAAADALQPFVGADGAVSFPMPALLIDVAVGAHGRRPVPAASGSAAC